jgi:hypothetical protein
VGNPTGIGDDRSAQSVEYKQYLLLLNMRLCRLIYSSQAVPSLQYSDLLDIMEKSEQNNLPVGLTGMLCYGDSMFLQVLEGSREMVNRTYHRIVNDKRHFNPEIIECSEVDRRHFAVWSMKTVQLGSYFPDKVKDMMLRYSTTANFMPPAMSPKQCMEFMLELQALYQTS